MMQNAQLLGVRQVDRVDLRLSFLVVAGFAVITIISYVNELSRAGLLDRHRRKQLYEPHQDVPSLRHRVERSAGEYEAPHDDALIQKNGQVHQLGLEIHNIKQALGSNKGNNGNPEQEINIAVHLGKNSSYLTANNSVRVYHFNNTMPNFFTTLEVPSLPIHDNSVKEVNETRTTLKTWLGAINNTKQAYRKATAVLVYQHDPGGYLTRDCLRSLVHDHHLSAPTNPLNMQFRKEWDMMPKFKRNTFKVLYGGLSFGVCEGIGRPCNYLVMVKHPLDRILTVYNICQKNTSSILCHFNKLNVQNMTLQQFIKIQGSSFFRKLLYYSKHCRLVGEDEICLPDTKTSFVLTAQERRIYLENILENLENWFSVIGLEEYFNESLQLFENTFGLNYTGCSQPTKLRELMRMDKHLWPLLSGSGRETLHGFQNMNEFTQVNNVTYSAIREKLLKDPQVLKWLSADLAIYDKLQELFKKQLEIFNVTTSVIKTMQNPNFQQTLAPQLRKFSKRIRRRELLRMKLKHDNTGQFNRSIDYVKHNKSIPSNKMLSIYPKVEHEINSSYPFVSRKDINGGAGRNSAAGVTSGIHTTRETRLPAEPKVTRSTLSLADHSRIWTTENPTTKLNELTLKPLSNENLKMHRTHNGDLNGSIKRLQKHRKNHRKRKLEEISRHRETPLFEDLLRETKNGLEDFLPQRVAHTMQVHGDNRAGYIRIDNLNNDNKFSAMNKDVNINQSNRQTGVVQSPQDNALSGVVNVYMDDSKFRTADKHGNRNRLENKHPHNHDSNGRRLNKRLDDLHRDKESAHFVKHPSKVTHDLTNGEKAGKVNHANWKGSHKSKNHNHHKQKEVNKRPIPFPESD